MLPRETIAEAAIPGGDSLALVRHGGDFIVMLGRDELMGTRMRFSEEQLAILTLERITAPNPRVLIGGYGLGFTFRAALARLPHGGSITVAEVVPGVLEWARGPLAHLTGDSLDDPRGRVILADVAALIDDAVDGTTPRYDAILLDVDNGPDGIVRDANDRLYTRTGIARARDALAPGGVLAVWSAAPDPAFARRLRDSGLAVEERTVRARPNNRGPRHTVWFAEKR
jgi:spermidine synthase